jgi:hypothetical protein
MWKLIPGVGNTIILRPADNGYAKEERPVDDKYLLERTHYSTRLKVT